MNKHFISILGSILLIGLLFSSISYADPDDGDDLIEIEARTFRPDSWTLTEITEEHINAAVTALPEIIKAAMTESGLPGLAVAVVRADKVTLLQGYGVRSLISGIPVNTDTVFQIASMSKPVGATVISKAIDMGTVAWDDPVIKYLPKFSLGEDRSYVSRHVTLADLYSHRSGLPDHAGDLLEDLGFKRAEIIYRLRMLPNNRFRDSYAYTNHGLTAAAEAVAVASGSNWEQLSEDLLYQPAGMNSTSSRYADYLAAPNRALLHVRKNGVWQVGSQTRNADAESPAGGVSSSIHDIARWMRLQLGNGTLDGKAIIKPEVIQIMRAGHVIRPGSPTPQARASMYGYGMGNSVDGTGHVRWSHSGAFVLGTGTSVTFLPAGDIAIAILSNGEPHGIPEAIIAAFMDVVETGAVQADWLTLYPQAFAGFYLNHSVLAGQQPPAKPVSAQSLDTYTGVYKNRYYGSAKISIQNKQLQMSLGPKSQKFKLNHWNGNKFSYFPRGENAIGISAIDFDLENGNFTVEFLNEYKLGTFQNNLTAQIY